ncbi:MAG TPA: 50S ribosomal protein L22 [Candidatus Paceibacterota bacterium]
MKAKLNNYRQAPRKVRLVTDLIKGKSVDAAMVELAHLPKRAAGPIAKLLTSALANAGGKSEDLFVKNITVDQGTIIKRSMPRAHGRAFPIHKHTSHIALELGVRGDMVNGKSKMANVKKGHE